MTDDAPTCVRCGRPMRHDTALICSADAAHLRRQLELVAKIAGDITLTVARMDRVARSGSGRPDDLGWWRASDPDPRRPGTNLAVRVMTDRSALPPMAMAYRPDVAERHDAAIGELGTWARLIAAERGLAVYGKSHRDHPVKVLAEWLAGQLEWLRHHPAADEAFQGIEQACRTLERLVDRPPDRIVVGMCPCGCWLYALTGAETVVCQGCGTGYNVEASRQQLRDDLEDRLMTGAQIATMAVHLGIAPDRGKVRNVIKVWAQRGRIAAHGVIDGDPVYRFGDTLGLLIDAYARAA